MLTRQVILVPALSLTAAFLCMNAHAQCNRGGGGSGEAGPSAAQVAGSFRAGAGEGAGGLNPMAAMMMMRQMQAMQHQTAAIQQRNIQLAAARQQQYQQFLLAVQKQRMEQAHDLQQEMLARREARHAKTKERTEQRLALIQLRQQEATMLAAHVKPNSEPASKSTVEHSVPSGVVLVASRID